MLPDVAAGTTVCNQLNHCNSSDCASSIFSCLTIVSSKRSSAVSDLFCHIGCLGDDMAAPIPSVEPSVEVVRSERDCETYISVACSLKLSSLKQQLRYSMSTFGKRCIRRKSGAAASSRNMQRVCNQEHRHDSSSMLKWLESPISLSAESVRDRTENALD